ncbi:MAG: extracellular solute-binding protein [Chloroflexota bacterium]|nr:extracellular solute-binding protein [Chloroflexota bacterium]
MNKSIFLLKVNLRLVSVAVLIMTTIFLSACNTATPTASTTPPEYAEVTLTPRPETTPTEDTIPTVDVTPTQQISTALMVDPEDLEGISIRFMHPWSGESALALEEIATQFSLTNPWGIWVDVQSQGSENLLVETLQSDLESGDLPGLIAVHPYALSDLEDDYHPVLLTDYINSPEWGIEPDAQADIPSAFLAQFTLEGNLTALPIAPQAAVLFYNQTWAEELEISSLPEDARAFRQQSCDATYANQADNNVENDGTGGWLINRDPEVLASWYRAFGGQLPINDPPNFNDEASREAFGYLKGVYDEGCIWIGRQSEPYFYFANRYTLMYAGSLNQIPKQMGWMSVAENEDEWKAIGFPGPDGRVVLVDSPGLMVSADTPENQMAAWLFARYLLEPDVQAKLVQRLFSIPVRSSALAFLEDFERDYPQWAQTVEMMDAMEVLPISDGWGIAQWVLQDAFERVLRSEANQIPNILEELGRLINELEGVTP